MANAKPIKMKPAETELQTTNGITIKLATEDGRKLQVVNQSKEIAQGITVTSYSLQIATSKAK
jgi:hypothetical protein